MDDFPRWEQVLIHMEPTVYDLYEDWYVYEMEPKVNDGLRYGRVCLSMKPTVNVTVSRQWMGECEAV